MSNIMIELRRKIGSEAVQLFINKLDTDMLRLAVKTGYSVFQEIVATDEEVEVEEPTIPEQKEEKPRAARKTAKKAK